MTTMKRIWQKCAACMQIRTRYTRSLENEVARLRSENRALVNSILGVAGIPPVRTAAVAAIAERAREDSSVAGELLSSVRVSDSREGAVAPLRRRSWQQIGRTLELEDARAAQRERETAPGTFPAPRGVVPRA